METNLDLTNVSKEERKLFCEYVISCIKTKFLEDYDESKTFNLQYYIDNNDIIKWEKEKKKEISIYTLYMLGLQNLIYKRVDENNYEIYIDRDKLIPNSYTTIYSIISLLEYGTLSVRKYGLLTETMKEIDKNLTELYISFKIGE